MNNNYEGNNNLKQAYLIMAHKDDFVFRTLLRMLDDSRNDIFIHMDAKNKDYDLIPIKPNNINLINSTIDDIPERSVRFLVTRDLQLVANIDRRVKNDYVLLVGDDGVIETYEL